MHTRRFGKGLAVAMLFAAVWLPSPARANTGATVRASGAQPNGSTPATSVPDTTSPALALDGLVVAFSSDATNLVPNDTNGVSDVFVRDLKTGKITRVSVGAGGAQANGASWDPSLSVDGRYVAFVSSATNLVPNDTNGYADVFLRDLRTKRTQLVSIASDGTPADGDSSAPFVSLFGRWVTFESSATNLSETDDNGLPDAFLRDTATHTTERIDPPDWDQSAPLAAGESWPSPPVKTYTTHAQISYDGRFVSFTRGAQGYTSIPGAAGAAMTQPLPDTATTPAALDTFFLDRRTHRTTQIPAPPYASRLPNGQTLRCRPMSDHAAISADGRFAAFESWSACEYDHAIVKNPVANTMIYRFDIQHPNALALVSLNSWGVAGSGSGPEGTGGDSGLPSISANGAVIAFQSGATNLVPGDTNGKTDVFVRDLGARTTSRASTAGDGAEATGTSARPSLSYEGRNVAFESDATNIVKGDTNGTGDIFVHDRQNFLPNRAPVLAAPVTGRRTINAFDPVHLQLRARDPDGDPIRYGVIYWWESNGVQVPVAGLPDGATINPVTGAFDWTPRPRFNPDAPHQDACAWCQVEVKIVFWAGDPRGNSDVKLADFSIRDSQATLQCKVFNQCAA